jgi:hypothetical protein
MKRVAMLGVLTFFAGSIQSAPDRKPPEGHKNHDSYMKCSKACTRCQRECDSCFSHCKRLLTEGKKDHAKTLQTCVDCGDCCALAAKLTARVSPFSSWACECCAKCCDECAKECEKFKEDSHMSRCAKECRTCAKACRDMIALAKS